MSYIVAGDPIAEATVPALHALVDAGTDIIELGVPFSDPMAEGPVIQRGHERALAHDVSLRSVLAMVAEFRRCDDSTPIVLMGYANPIEVMGYTDFAAAAAEVGVDGVLTVDMPLEEAGELNAALQQRSIDNIFLIAPTTSPERAENICALATGYIYYVSLKGVTGAGHLDSDSVERAVGQFKEMTSLPICVGFGIKDASSAAMIAAHADGVVVGSVLVQAMADAVTAEQVGQRLAEVVAPIAAAIN